MLAGAALVAALAVAVFENRGPAVAPWSGPFSSSQRACAAEPASKPGEQKSAEKPAADDGVAPNDMCHVCHINFAEEKLATTHAKHKVLCRDCHGPSAAHMADENIGATKPDKIYAAGQIATMCGKCHKPEDHPTLKAKTRAARLAASKKTQEEIKGRKIDPPGVCTDCHGNHWIPPK
jgi:hypothetical protein